MVGAKELGITISALRLMFIINKNNKDYGYTSALLIGMIIRTL